jgi:phospholipase/carboxylesterase
LPSGAGSAKFGPVKERRTQLGELDAVVVEPDGGGADLQVVLCHGFGAPGDDLVPLAQELAQWVPALGQRCRFAFLQAPLTLADLGMPQGRAWWYLEVEVLAGRRNWEEFVQAVPDGLPRARRLLHAAVDEFVQLTGVPWGKTVLGGFSQGAMLTTDLCLRLEERPAGLCILSGTLLSARAWRERALGRAGLPCFMSHGTADPLLPFEVAERLRELLLEASWPVEFVSFPGGHGLSGEVLQRLAAWLAARLG